MKMNPVCEKMKSIRISGDVIPASWYQNIRKGKNKTDLVACAILANIMYWYRPTEVRDETTDKVIGYRQKFKADKLQKSYANYAEMLGIPKSTIKKAIDNLVNLKLVTRTFRNFTTKEGLRLTNIMYIEPILDNVLAVSYTTSPTNRGGYNTEFVGDIDNKKCGTNTEITTDITTGTTTNNNKAQKRTVTNKRNNARNFDFRSLKEFRELEEEAKSLYIEYIDFRKSKRLPCTEIVHRRLLKKYDEYGGSQEIIEKALINGWRDFYPVRRENGYNGYKGNSGKSGYKSKEEIEREKRLSEFDNVAFVGRSYGSKEEEEADIEARRRSGEYTDEDEDENSREETIKSEE